MSTAAEASLSLAEYEQANSDLPRPIRRQMGAFVLAGRYPIEEVERLFDQRFGQTLTRHRSWLYWMVLRTSGLSHHWEAFRDAIHEHGGLRGGIDYLWPLLTDEEKDLFRQRLDRPGFRPAKVKRTSPPPFYYWSKGGCWPWESPFTKIIIHEQHLTRDHSFSHLTLRMEPDALRRLESELANLINPDDHLFPDAIDLAISYTTHRLAEIAGWKKKKPSLITVSWFFQTRVPAGDGKFAAYWYGDRAPRRHVRKGRRDANWDWFPEGEVE